MHGQWRGVLRAQKAAELRRDAEVAAQGHEREVDRRDALLQVRAWGGGGALSQVLVASTTAKHPAGSGPLGELGSSDSHSCHHKIHTALTRITHITLKTLDRDLDEAEEQRQAAARAHLASVDALLGLQRARVGALEARHGEGLRALLDEFERCAGWAGGKGL